MTKKTSRPMGNERRDVSKVVVYRGWQALTLWEMVFLAMLQASRVGKTQSAMWQLIQSPVEMSQLIHSPIKMAMQLTLPEETWGQLTPSRLKMGHSPMNSAEQLTLPEETRGQLFR